MKLSLTIGAVAGCLLAAAGCDNRIDIATLGIGGAGGGCGALGDGCVRVEGSHLGDSTVTVSGVVLKLEWTIKSGNEYSRVEVTNPSSTKTFSLTIKAGNDPCRSCDVGPGQTILCPPSSVTPQRAISHVDFCLKSTSGCSADAQCPGDGKVCTTARCIDGVCQQVNNTASCNDENPCTQNDTCANGQCGGTPIPGCTSCSSDAQCPSDDNPCTKAKCLSGVCDQVNDPNATCDDGKACTQNDTCVNKECKGTAIVGCVSCEHDGDCPADDNPCTTAKCVSGACQQVKNTLDCNDGNSCTQNDRCDNGQCKGTFVPGCVNCEQDAQCPGDSNVCTKAKCVSGVCAQVNDPTAVCDDGEACTQNDACIDKECKGTPIAGCVSCDNDAACSEDDDPCTTAKCVSGVCQQVNNTATCNDGNACTQDDACDGGQCKGTPIAGCSTCGSDADCSADNNVCTTATCVSGVCQQVNNAASCDDDNECTVNDTCSAGACVPGAQKADGTQCWGGVCCAGKCVAGANACEPPLCEDLGPAQGYNVFLRGAHTMIGSDIAGCAAAGGAVVLNGVGVGHECSSEFAYVGGATVSLTNGQSNGSIAHASPSPDPVSWNFGAGSFSDAQPINFTDAFTLLSARGAAFAALVDTAPALGCDTGQIVLQGTLTARTNVFSVTPECLAAATSFTIDAPAGATVLVNIRPSGTSGYSLTLSNFMMFRQGGIVPSGILLNALEATSVTMSSFQLDGSLLAPNAAVSFSNGNLLGTLVADSLQGNGQFHSHPMFSICAGGEVDPAPGADDT